MFTTAIGGLLSGGLDTLGGLGGIANSIGINLGGGSAKTSAKVSKRKQIRNDLQQYTTPAERRAFVNKYDSSGRIQSTPDGMAYFFTGEGDYKHKNVGASHKQFLNDLPSWIQQKKQGSSNVLDPVAGGLPSDGGGSLGGGEKKILLYLGGGLVVAKLMGWI